MIHKQVNIFINGGILNWLLQDNKWQPKYDNWRLWNTTTYYIAIATYYLVTAIYHLAADGYYLVAAIYYLATTIYQLVAATYYLINAT